MSKKEEAKASENAKEQGQAQEQEQAQEQKNEVSKNDTYNVDFEAIETALVKVGLNLEYLELAEGEEVRGVFMGVQNQIIDGNEKEVIAVMTRDGGKVSAGFTLLQALRNKPEGTPISIIYEGKKDLGGGKKLGMYKVYELDL